VTEQDKEIRRVSARIARSITGFCRWVFTTRGGVFHMDELGTFVRLNAGITAPDSPSRILRQLRAKGQLDYVVLSRAASRYRITHVQGNP
jgi:hypothetical protein